MVYSMNFFIYNFLRLITSPEMSILQGCTVTLELTKSIILCRLFLVEYTLILWG